MNPIMTGVIALTGLTLLAFGPKIVQRIVYADLYRAMNDVKSRMGVQVPWHRRLNWEIHNRGLPIGIAAFVFALTGWPVVFGSTFVRPANDVWAGGIPRGWCTHTFKVKTATSLRSGVAVIKDTTDEEIKVAGAAALNVIAWLGVRNFTDPDWDHTTAPAAADQIECVLQMPGVWIKARNGANLAMGALTNTSSTGRLAAAATSTAADTQKVVARVFQDSDGSGTETDALAVVSL